MLDVDLVTFGRVGVGGRLEDFVSCELVMATVVN